MSNTPLTVGQRVKFAGFKTASFGYPEVFINDTATVTSVKKPDQFGFDYWAAFDHGGTFAFNEGELLPL